jgi:hypothetical protein|tara:strand:- start:866 stop:1318 length:453 start_codon:yes stop_codon:yes gene_type:complete
MDKAKVIERLELLTGLIDKTEPDIPSDKALFSHHIIQNQENIKHIRDIIKGNMLVDEDSQRENIIRIMKDSNRFWKIRNMILSGKWDNLELLEIQEQLEEYIDGGQKINAIKYYREVMSTHMGEQVTLREAKDVIDGFAKNRTLDIMGAT